MRPRCLPLGPTGCTGFGLPGHGVTRTGSPPQNISARVPSGLQRVAVPIPWGRLPAQSLNVRYARMGNRERRPDMIGIVNDDPQSPKIELHVHLEGTVRAATLLEIARRNGVTLPATTVDDLSELYQFRDFQHFIDVWVLITSVLRTAADFRQVVVDYAAEAASFGAVYLEGIFSPGRVDHSVPWDEIFSGYCDGARQAQEEHGVIVRLTPDIHRGASIEVACAVARWAVRFKESGVVGLGLGGLEADYPPEPYAPAFAIARDSEIGSVPHAGEVAGPASIRGALDALGADRIRHGIRAIEDPSLVSELADREIVLDVCPTSNLRTGAVASLADHPLPKLMAGGVVCSISTDDPAMFNTDLVREYQVAADLGCSPEVAFRAGIRGALCDKDTRSRLKRIADSFSWAASA